MRSVIPYANYHGASPAAAATGLSASQVLAFSPILFIDTTNPGGIYEEITGASATTVALVGQSAGTILDYSGNGHHVTAVSTSTRGVVQSDGSVYGTDHRYNISYTSALSASVNIYVAIKTVDTMYILASNGGSNYFFSPHSGSSSATVSSVSVGSPTYAINGVVVTLSTRDAAYQAASTGLWTILEFRGADTTVWGGMDLFNYGSSWYYTGSLGPMVIMSSASDTLLSTDTIRRWMAQQMGVTL